MGTRVVIPESVKIPISNDDWILIKQRLNAGEFRQSRARRYALGPDGFLRVDPLTVEIATVTAYLLDWSLTAPDGQPLVIRGQSYEVVKAALDAIDTESFDEIFDAIDRHDKALKAAREMQKKTTRTGETASSAISSSPNDSAGGMSGLPN